MLKVVIETKIPSQLFQVFASVGFWNAEGKETYELNKAGKMGGAFSQDQARKLSKEDFILNCLLSELKTFSEGNNWPAGFTFGRTGSHIWVHRPDNARALLIHF